MIGDVEVATLRICAARADADVTKAVVGTALGAAVSSFAERRLGPAAVLVIHRFSDPAPGVLGGRAGGSWAAACDTALEATFRDAARPACGPVPAAAGAVWFRDRSELLAALAGDLLTGQIAVAWWWRPLLRGRGDVRAAVEATWAEHPTAVPAALAQLAGQGLAVPFVRALPDTRAREIAVATATAWGAPSATLPRLAEPGRDPRSGPSPWSDRVPEAAASDLGPGARLLLGVGLLAQRAPVIAARPAFWVEVCAWLARAPEVELRETGTAASDTSSGPTRNAAPAPDAASEVDDARSSGRRNPPGPTSTTAAPERFVERTSSPSPWPDDPVAPTDGPGPPTRRSDRTPTGSPASPPHPAARVGAQPEGERLGRATTDDPDVPTLPSGPADPATIETTPHAAGSAADPEHRVSVPRLAGDGPDQPVDTALGGLFLIPQIGLSRGWYPDFTRPRDRGIGLDPWRLVAMLGTELLDDPDAVRDPVWALLDALARDDAADRVVWRAWVREQAEAVRSELTAVFDCPEGEVGGRLIRRRARVLVTATRVDVRLRLDELQIEIRLSGMDRDPGWFPASGRVIALHFD